MRCVAVISWFATAVSATVTSTTHPHVQPALLRLPQDSITLGLPLAAGAFGVVHHARGPEGQPYVAKRAARNKANAEAYLHVEAAINSKLRVSAPGSAYLAPFLGVASIGWVDHLIFAACPGVKHTLDWYLDSQTPRKGELAHALGLAPSDNEGVDLKRLAERLLKEMLSGLVLLHRAGVVHRDIKPENWLVDAQTHSLRLIDLGSACSLDDDAYLQQISMPITSVWAPPELCLTPASPWAFDVYSTALVFLRSLCSSSHEFESLRTELMGTPAMPLSRWMAQHHPDSSEDPLIWRLVGGMLAEDPKDRVAPAEVLCSSLAAGWCAEDAAADTLPATLASCEDDFSCRLPFDDDDLCVIGV